MNPDLIHYACIAREATLLAEFARTSDLETLARRCILNPPPYHSMYTHTVRRRSFTFLLDGPLLFFAISDELLALADCLRFLNRLKSAFHDSERRPEGSLFAAGSFQPELDAVMREAASASERNSSSVTSTPSLSSVSQDGPGGQSGLGFTPLLGSKLCKGLNLNLKKKKKANGGGGSRSDVGNAADEGCAEPGAQKSGGGGEWQKARQVWKKHVWVVLLLDLFVCAVLFGIWLWVCRGFKCIDN